MTNYMAATDENYPNDMRTATSMTEEAEDHNDAAIRQRSVVLYSVLCSYLTGDAKSLAMSYEDTHNGFELWRVLTKEMELLQELQVEQPCMISTCRLDPGAKGNGLLRQHGVFKWQEPQRAL